MRKKGMRGCALFLSLAVAFPAATPCLAEAGQPQAKDAAIVPVYDAASNTVTVDVPAGYTVVNNGTDFEQVVADDFTVHQPLMEKEVKLALKITDPSGNTTVSEEYSLMIPGIYGESTGNEKPQVIPEIAEWHSDSTEQFEMMESSEIILSSEELRYVGEEFAKDLEDVTGRKLPVSVGNTAVSGDFYFTLDSEDTMLGKEGYAMEIGESVTAEGTDTTGLYWATRTILQAMKLSEDGASMPCGEMRDYPKYEVRSFVFDVGRKPVSMDTLQNVAKNMAWYKMNDFHVHLNDSLIFLQDYYNRTNPNPDDAFSAYSGFRLESDIQNDAGVSLASADYHYTKEEFQNFMKECRQFGVDIVPEIDAPAHALAITEVFPEYAVHQFKNGSQTSLVDHLDISKPEVVEFIKSLYDEYIDDGTFDEDTIIHVGADEFEASAKAYREFINEFLPYIKEKRKIRIWGGLTRIKDNPLTEVTRETVEGCQINLWSKDWADGIDMYNLGFELINTIDEYGYMVPDGSGSLGKYNDYLNKTYVFNNFEPNKVRILNGARFVPIPAGDKQMLGGAYALWQDNIDTRAHGLSEEDLFLRFFDSLPLYAEKTWANGQEKGSVAALDALTRVTGTAPNTNPYHEEESDDGVYAEYLFDGEAKADQSILGRDLTAFENADTDVADGSVALKLNGGESYAKTPLTFLGSMGKNSLSFEMKLDEVTPGQILFESDFAYGTHDIRIMPSGKLGFTRENFDYEFDYMPTAGQRDEVKLVAEKQKTTLYVNGRMVGTAVGSFSNKGAVRKSGIRNASLTLPVERIGSKTNAVKGIIDNVRIANENVGVPTVPTDKSGLQTVYQDCETLKKEEYTKESWDVLQKALERAKKVLDRENTLEETVEKVTEMVQKAKAGLVANPAIALKAELRKVCDSYAGILPKDYTETSWKVFAEALAAAQKMLADPNADASAVQQALAKLQSAKGGLMKKPDPEPIRPELPRKGSTHQDGKLKYKITESTEKVKTAAVTGAVRKNAGKVTIPAKITIQGYTYKVTAIADKAFRNGKKLTTAVIGKEVVKIGKNSFAGCKKLKAVTIQSTKLKSIGKNAFQGISAKAKIKVPKKKLAAYKKYLKKAKLSAKVKVVKK